VLTCHCEMIVEVVDRVLILIVFVSCHCRR
jgi:hypothetical protein